MTNRGVVRGVGQPGSLVEPFANVWVAGNPLNSPSSSAGDFAGILGKRPIPFYFLLAGGPTNAGKPGVGFAIDDYRFVPQTVTSSGIFGDNSSSLKIWMQPTFSTTVTDFGLTGISVGGFIGQGSPNLTGVSLAANGFMCAYGMHMDTGVPVFGMYGMQIHLGLIGVNATEAVGIDQGAMNAIGGTYTNGIFLRNNDNNMANVINKWNMQMAAVPSQHRGPFGIGGLAITNLPGINANNSVAGGTMFEVINQSVRAGGGATFADTFSLSAMPGVSAVAVANCTVVQGSVTVTSSAAFGSVVTGQFVDGSGIIPGTTVVAVGSTSSITLSLPCQTNSTTLTLNFTTIGAFNVASTLNSTTTVTSAALFGSVVVGQFVSGGAIVPGTIVTAVASSSSITISVAANATGAATLTFYNFSPPRMGTQLNWVTTTSAAATQIYGTNPPANTVQHYRAKVWARRTGGASGSANDSVAFSGDFLVSNQALTGSPQNAAALQPIAMGTLPGSFTANTGVTTIGSNTVTSTATFGSVAVGQLITGTGIPPGAWVIAKASSSSITISQNATATGSSLTFTFCAYSTTLTATVYGTVLQVIGPATTNVTWHCQVENSGLISN